MPPSEGTARRNRPDATRTGVPLRPFYGPGDLPPARREGLEDPGEFPFTRSRTREGYGDQLWVMAQYSGFGTAEETNARFRYLIERGQTGFSIALDLPTQVGLDSDDPLAEGEVGKVGVAIDSVDDVRDLFAGIDLTKLRQIRTTANCVGPIIAAMIIAVAEDAGLDPNEFSVLFQNDPLKEYPARGTWIFPPKAGVKLACDLVEHCGRHLPSWNPIQFSGAHYRESGATAVQEVAFAFADAIAYIETTMARGLRPEAFVPACYLFVYIHTDLLEEVAKLRAARRVWAGIMRDRFGVTDDDACRLNIFAWAGGSSLTVQQPLNNIVRVSIQTLAAALGGVQTLATASYDEGYAIPSEDAVTIALRTQQIVAEESGVAGVVDALGGSYAIEALTDEIEGEVLAEMERIESVGGAIGAVEGGYFIQELSESSYRWQQQLASGERRIVGVNDQVDDREVEIETFAQDSTTEARQVERLRRARSARSEEDARDGLEALRAAAVADENVMAPMIRCVRAGTTVGDICAVLKDVYGTYEQIR